MEDLGLLLQPVIFADVSLNGIVRGAMYALMASGLSLIFGLMGVKNFSHGEFFMLGSYIMFFGAVVLDLPFLLAILLAAAGMFLFGMVIERTLVRTLRKRAGRDWLLDAFVLTIGMMIVLQHLALIVFGTRRQGVPNLIPGGQELGPLYLSNDRLMILGAATVILTLLGLFIGYTRWGRAMRATGQDPDAAQTLGIDVGKVYTYTFGLGGALAGIAGGLLLPIFPAYPTVGLQPVIMSIASVILGGLGYVPGAIMAGLLLGLIEAYSTFLFGGGWQNVIIPVVVIAVLIFRPYGLFSSAKAERA